jgi:methylated-DNA-[protein]-cysteine S-methyltransferase
MFYSLFDTALGTCGIIYRSVEDGGIVHILLPGKRKDVETRIKTLHPESTETQSSKVECLETDIIRYLSGDDVTLSMDYLDTSICYPFQLKVLKTERMIPRGMVASYGWVARRINTKDGRAVGNALARNPFPLVVPCHRAIRSDRRLSGFQGGLEMKRTLLEMEGIEFDSKGCVEPQFILDKNPAVYPARTGLRFSAVSSLL